MIETKLKTDPKSPFLRGSIFTFSGDYYILDRGILIILIYIIVVLSSTNVLIL